MQFSVDDLPLRARGCIARLISIGLTMGIATTVVCQVHGGPPSPHEIYITICQSKKQRVATVSIPADHFASTQRWKLQDMVH